MILNLNNVTYNFGKKQEDVLKGINVSMNKGEVVCILGPSGCGKTTGHMSIHWTQKVELFYAV